MPSATPSAAASSGTSAICQAGMEAKGPGDFRRRAKLRAAASPPATSSDQRAPGTTPNHQPAADSRTQNSSNKKFIAQTLPLPMTVTHTEAADDP